MPNRIDRQSVPGHPNNTPPRPTTPMNQPVVTPGDGFVPGATNRAAIQTLFISNDEVTQTELSSIGEVIKARAADAKQYSAAKHRYRIEYAGYNMQTEPAGLTLAAGD